MLAKVTARLDCGAWLSTRRMKPMGADCEILAKDCRRSSPPRRPVRGRALPFLQSHPWSLRTRMEMGVRPVNYERGVLGRLSIFTAFRGGPSRCIRRRSNELRWGSTPNASRNVRDRNSLLIRFCRRLIFCQRARSAAILCSLAPMRDPGLFCARYGNNFSLRGSVASFSIACRSLRPMSLNADISRLSASSCSGLHLAAFWVGRRGRQAI